MEQPQSQLGLRLLFILERYHLQFLNLCGGAT